MSLLADADPRELAREILQERRFHRASLPQPLRKPLHEGPWLVWSLLAAAGMAAKIPGVGPQPDPERMLETLRGQIGARALARSYFLVMALRPRHHRPTTTVIAAAAALTAAAATTIATAATNKPPHLQGRFPVTATITASNFKGVRNGTRSADVYTFTSHCKIGTCKTVTLVRQGGTAKKHYRSTLRRTKSNIYVGTEGPYPYPCPGRPGGSTSKFTAKHTIRITGAYPTGRVAAFDGSSKYTITGCVVGRFVNYRLRAKRQ